MTWNGLKGKVSQLKKMLMTYVRLWLHCVGLGHNPGALCVTNAAVLENDVSNALGALHSMARRCFIVQGTARRLIGLVGTDNFAKVLDVWS